MNRQNRLKTLLAGGLLLATAIGFSAGTAQAETAANATILNVVNVEYKDAGGNGQDGTPSGAAFVESASASVSVELLAAAPTVTGPTPASGQTVASGATQVYEFEMYSNANGDDEYDFTINGTATADADVAGLSEIISLVTYPDGTTANPGATAVNDFNIGASVILADDDSDTVSVPFGSDNNIEAGDDVIIDGTKYTVNAVAAGTAPAHSADSLTAETNTTISLYDYGTTNAADLSGVDLSGLVISELYLFEVSVTATAINGNDGESYFTVTADTDTDGGAAITPISDINTTFATAGLTITKQVRNVSQANPFANSDSGKPGETLEYRITVTNAGSDATSVEVSDAVPVYTTLVAGSAYGTNGGGTIFAQVDDGTNTVNVTTATDSETQPGGTTETGFGETAGTAAGDSIAFYIGDDSTNAAGGTVSAGITYTIIYQVTID